MDIKTTYNTIRQAAQLCLPGCRVVLFGSRAKGTHDSLSDYDLLIVTQESFTEAERLKWSSRLDRVIVEAIKAPIDLILSNEEEIRQKKDLPGNIIRTAIREGVSL